ncbi:DUF732 domain-containing protein [Microbacterium sp. MYb62]|uniref:DUF732 domain-containing protein n=1 Tax=Microbacterium sp. MYb62 TaxID=1848690 RepID=UPI000CFDD321|nr:DUF732 domain-containing protein [Microbacterium sp. MYb62]PRB14458.1 hypothetical protein CQ042_11095 [Microbacterium sp. MYb62]
MPKVTAAILAALVAVALTGCAGTTPGSGDERAAPAATESASPVESAAPLSAETAPPEISDPDTAFLAYVRKTLLPETQIPRATDKQLIDAGHEACRQLESGVALEDVRVVEGETAHPSTGGYYDTSAIMGGAILSYCPAFA